MQIHLAKDDEDWLRAQVAVGRFSSLDHPHHPRQAQDYPHTTA
jgi:hypothetical protein